MTDPARVAPPQVWPGGIRTLGPFLLVPAQAFNAGDVAAAERFHTALGEAIEHLRVEFPDRRGDRGSPATS